MNNEFVPYEQALELKELGFDEPCLKYWNGIGEYFDQKDWFNWNQSKKFVSIPLYQQAFGWFRENHGLIGEIFSQLRPSSRFMYGFKIGGSDIIFDGFKTYENAELECLKKLIEIVKNK